MPEDYEQAWRRLDEEYEQRERERIAALIENTLRDHQWTGGYLCSCGTRSLGPYGWGKHLLELVLVEGCDDR